MTKPIWFKYNDRMIDTVKIREVRHYTTERHDPMTQITYHDGRISTHERGFGVALMNFLMDEDYG